MWIAVITPYDTIAETVKEQDGCCIIDIRNQSFFIFKDQAGCKSGCRCILCIRSSWLTSETIYELLQAFLESKKAAACVSYQDKMGNPCIFRKYYGELLALEGDKGGKKVLMKHLEDTCIYE